MCVFVFSVSHPIVFTREGDREESKRKKKHHNNQQQQPTNQQQPYVCVGVCIFFLQMMCVCLCFVFAWVLCVGVHATRCVCVGFGFLWLSFCFKKDQVFLGDMCWVFFGLSFVARVPSLSLPQSKRVELSEWERVWVEWVIERKKKRQFPTMYEEKSVHWEGKRKRFSLSSSSYAQPCSLSYKQDFNNSRARLCVFERLCV